MILPSSLEEWLIVMKHHTREKQTFLYRQLHPFLLHLTSQIVKMQCIGRHRQMSVLVQIRDVAFLARDAKVGTVTRKPSINMAIGGIRPGRMWTMCELSKR